MSLYMRLPKRGFSNARFKNNFAAVNLSSIEAKFNSGDTVTKESLIDKKIINGADRSSPVRFYLMIESKVLKNLHSLELTSFQKTL